MDEKEEEQKDEGAAKDTDKMTNDQFVSKSLEERDPNNSTLDRYIDSNDANKASKDSNDDVIASKKDEDKPSYEE